MLEEKLLIWRLARGRSDALERIYNRYKNELLALAIALSNDKSSAEDAVHDVFVALAEGLVIFGFITALMILGKV